ncbi:hypothetical protein [Mycoplasma struthionis]|uniref:Uncharacterized protein n=1 Tax=Mycoplasma struthionis TaxID=538220 RepID=A0A502MIU9_9MOLU|nr:hypothetical protein [Mycoplasma struthionis]TPI01944.1 hypothetical protein FJM01_01660 [Mycoplasma struthionis]
MMLTPEELVPMDKLNQPQKEEKALRQHQHQHPHLLKEVTNLLQKKQRREERKLALHQQL